MVTGNFVYARSRTQRVVSFFITESELHSMVSSCSDAIFVKRCLSGKIVWIQALVLQQEVSVGHRFQQLGITATLEQSLFHATDLWFC